MTRVLAPDGYFPPDEGPFAPIEPGLPPGARVVLVAFPPMAAQAPPFFDPALELPAYAAPSNDLTARVVRGEILRDPPGRLYELCGRELRPLHRLVQGPSGEVIELRPRTALRPRAAEAPRAWDATEGPAPAHAAASEEEGTTAGPPYRPLLPEPGVRCVARLGDFKALLSPQLAHPERLRDGHRLACTAQVYEATKAQPVSALAKAIEADSGSSAAVQSLSEEAALRLGLTRELPAARPNAARARPGWLLPRERVFRLVLEGDPTAEAATSAGDAQPPAAPAPASPRTAIPERFLAPWEFQWSRDEALEEMEAEDTSSRPLAALWRAVRNRIGGRRELERWRARLEGRSPDEQLWGVRPPRCALRRPEVRGWARRCLETAGYEAGTMLREWEIYWRRKGAQGAAA